jgi:hypothetical protein
MHRNDFALTNNTFAKPLYTTTPFPQRNSTNCLQDPTMWTTATAGEREKRGRRNKAQRELKKRKERRENCKQTPAATMEQCKREKSGMEGYEDLLFRGFRVTFRPCPTTGRAGLPMGHCSLNIFCY